MQYSAVQCSDGERGDWEWSVQLVHSILQVLFCCLFCIGSCSEAHTAHHGVISNVLEEVGDPIRQGPPPLPAASWGGRLTGRVESACCGPHDQSSTAVLPVIIVRGCNGLVSFEVIPLFGLCHSTGTHITQGKADLHCTFESPQK